MRGSESGFFMIFMIFVTAFVVILMNPDYFARDLDGSDLNKWAYVNTTSTNSSENGLIHYSQNEGNMTRMKIFFGEYTSGGLFSDSKPITKDFQQFDPHWNFTKDTKVIVITETHKGTCYNEYEDRYGSYLLDFNDRDYIETCFENNNYFVVLDK